MTRVWVYQSNRSFSVSERETINDILQEFVEQWTAHGNQLAGSFEILYNIFIVLKVDESKAMVTGCSIDKSVHLLKQIEQKLNVQLFDRLGIAFRDARKNGDISLVSRTDFEALISSGEVDTETLVFNNMVGTNEELQNNWEIPLKDSWHANVFL